MNLTLDTKPVAKRTVSAVEIGDGPAGAVELDAAVLARYAIVSRKKLFLSRAAQIQPAIEQR